MGAHALSGFLAVREEVAITEALRTVLARGSELWLPWVDGPRLHLAKVEDLDRDLVPGWKGVLEPAEDRRSATGPAHLDVAIVPGVAFDRRGQRLGYGGGHFDRLLADLPPSTLVVGCAFAVQVLAEVPAEDHDVPVDVIVTEAEVHRTGA